MNAMQVKCPHCLAGIGQPCLVPGTRQKLTLSPAHPSRLELAGLTPAYTAVEHYRDRHRPTDTPEARLDAEN